ncbi:MAG: cytochrome c [Gaiellaceae bacterium]
MKVRSLSGGFLVAIGLLAAGCSGSKHVENSPGAKLFASAGCAGCHILKAAGANGQVGPNLDELKPDQATVAHQVLVGGNGMPSFRRRLSTPQITQVAAFVAQASRSSGKAASFQPDNSTVQSCRQSSKQFCYRQAFANIAYRDGPEKALALLATDDRAMASVHADCHQISHWVGHAALARYHGNAAEALAHGAMTCNSGYYHGVIERSFAGLPRNEVVSKARQLCTTPAVTKEEFLLYQCVHGLGHGLMIYSGDDLPWSLRACHRLQTSFDRISCTGGVFMQNLAPGMVTSRFLKGNDPIYPCNAVAETDKLYCYLMVTSRILTLDNYNWSKTAKWCNRSEPAWVATCFQSFGRDASGFSRYQPRETIRLCLLAGRGTGECLYGAARDYGNNYAGGKEAAQLCHLAGASFRPRCYEGIGTILGAINRYGSERRAACARVTPRRYRRDCLRGAAVL